MKLAISNIAWDNHELDDHLKLIKQLGCRGLEIAPSSFWPKPEKSSLKERKALKEKINHSGLEIIGLHALLYSHPDLEIFGSESKRQATAEYLQQLFELCRDLGGKTLVYGSPPSRRLQGRKEGEAFAIAVDFFGKLAQKAAPFGVFLCIEPLSAKETEFVKTSAEGADLVTEINHPHFRLHLDAKAMVDSSEDVKSAIHRYAPLLRHFHVSDGGLMPPGTSGFDHRIFGETLNEAGYGHYISIEMRRGFGPSREVVQKTIAYVKEKYSII